MHATASSRDSTHPVAYLFCASAPHRIASRLLPPQVINPKFPDMGGLVEYSHARGIKMGWYENGCACGERHALDINYQGDVRQLNKLGFDGVKLDGCGAQRNMTRYAELMNATGRTFLIENCHWGRCTSSDDSSCPDTTWCPFNW
jgi:hypothetical protein